MSETKETKKELTAEERIMVLFQKLQEKKAEVAGAERPQFITNGQFRYSESQGMTVDIMTVRDERKLVEIYTFLLERSVRYAEAAVELGVDAKFTWLSFTVEEWLKDLKTRVSVLQIAKRKAELVELEKRVNLVVTPELRQKLELAALEATLNA